MKPWRLLTPRRRAATLAARLTRTLILWVGGVWLLGVLGVAWYVGHEIDANFDNELVEVAHRLFPLALRNWDDAPAHVGASAWLIPAPGTFADADLPYRLVTPEARVLALSQPALAVRFGTSLERGFADTTDWRIYTLHHPTRPILLQVADPLHERRTALARSLLGLVVPLVAALPLLALLLRRIARRELRALAQLAQEIGLRNGQQLAPITLHGLPLELQRVQRHVNHLLERLALALDVERALAANAAHELRTPLAAVRVRLQSALEHGLQSGDVEAALQALQTLTRRAEKLLQLSRAESSHPLTRERVDLTHLATHVAQEFWGSGDASDRLDLVLEHSGAAITVWGDLDALAIALRNLVENALRHAPGQPVQLIVGPGATLTVRDRGPGVPAALLNVLRQRHRRLSSERTGFGMGLSIVATIVGRHGGTLTLASPRTDGLPGFEARIALN